MNRIYNILAISLLLSLPIIAQRASINVSVYNTGARFELTRAPFGSQKDVLDSVKFQEKHTKITTQKVQTKGDFSVDMTGETFHIGHTNVDYKVNGNENTNSVSYCFTSPYAAATTRLRYFGWVRFANKSDPKKEPRSQYEGE